MGIKRRHSIVRVTPQRIGDTIIALRNIIPLANVIQVLVFDHKVMKSALPTADHHECMVPFIQMEKVQTIGSRAIVRYLKPQYIAVNWHHNFNVLHV